MHTEYENLIKALDIPTPQVSIDARIVEVNTNYSKELGIQWGALVKPTPQTQISGTNLTGRNGFFSGNPLLVNLPAAVSQGAGGSIGIGYISAGTLRALDVQLSALEADGKGKIISNPRVMTMDHQKAKILQGKKIPYETFSQEGTQTAFVDAAIELIVTPHITPEGTILMNIETKKNEADFLRGHPTARRQ
jgi:type IV pilus assembly protein PilQ